MKKTLVSLAAVAMSFAVVTPAFAVDMQRADRGGTNTKNFTSTTGTFVVNSNSASVFNMVGSSSNTGGVVIGSGHGDVKGIKLKTGNAESTAEVENNLGATDSEVTAPACGCETTAPEVDQAADRGGDNTVDTTTENNAAVVNANESEAANVVGATSSTGMVGIGSAHGDVKDIDAETGTSKTNTKVGNTFGVIFSKVTR